MYFHRCSFSQVTEDYLHTLMHAPQGDTNLAVDATDISCTVVTETAVPGFRLIDQLDVRVLGVFCSRHWEPLHIHADVGQTSYK